MNHKTEIPHDIMRLCLEFYNKIEIIWDVFSSKLTDFISDDGLEVIMNGQEEVSTFASSIGWDKGIHTFTLKQLKTPAVSSGIGVVSSELIQYIASRDEEPSWFMSSSETDLEATAYILDASFVCKLEQGFFDIIFDINRVGIEDNDRVTVVIDCDQWKLTFYINDEICNKSFDIDKNRTYHAALCTYSESIASYQLVDTTIDIRN